MRFRERFEWGVSNLGVVFEEAWVFLCSVLVVFFFRGRLGMLGEFVVDLGV